ncbi:hypothetical protein GLV88_03730 [Staphylococcus hyicus]|uniref:hypothetical protein n=1 Tax=Staphylococcus hyicus TaxID=1284 RepID=UPI00130D5DCB|nr:hypothetical protein [Staphylococcus hyicus]MCE5154361.1 hypothetical protein [Staphylococcus hyicus]MDP4461322.1 hypothetical protein [Staphylococcus hyicus]NJH99572.1 hypothetical protein [Staphylococcus hyicus]
MFHTSDISIQPTVTEQHTLRHHHCCAVTYETIKDDILPSFTPCHTVVQMAKTS